MKKLTLVAGACLTLVALGAQAHAHLKASNPKEAAVVMEMHWYNARVKRRDTRVKRERCPSETRKI